MSVQTSAKAAVGDDLGDADEVRRCQLRRCSGDPAGVPARAGCLNTLVAEGSYDPALSLFLLSDENGRLASLAAIFGVIAVITVIIIVRLLIPAGLSAEWLAAIAAMTGTALGYRQK
ncbi:hypothetical protein ACWDSD_42410 [Streptomyces spiralis]